ASLPMSVMAAVFEAVVAAVYLDGGFEAARSLVRRLMALRVDHSLGENDTRNYKSLLQQMAQRKFGRTPSYRTLDVQGPDHSKCFQVAATIGPRVYPGAWGASKKEAEQLAAKNALFELSGENLPHAAE
ncbi:MAG: putative dsRNA-binding protein, partial [Planctomycetaceae bacterium]